MICEKHKDCPDFVDIGDYNGLQTMWEAFERTVKRVPNNRFLGTRNVVTDDGKRSYSWKTFSEVHQLANEFAAGVLSLGLCPE